jgi:drug/metabolite transporter (DMT)-like permease
MRYLYSFLLLLTSLFWGGNFVVGKVLVDYADSLTLTVLRWVIATACLLPVVWLKETQILPPRRALLPLLAMGLTGVALFNVFMFWALERTSAINVGLLSTLNPVAIAIFSFFLLRERMNGLQMAGMIVSFFGVLVVLSKGETARILALEFNIGDLWMLAAVAMWGLYAIAAKFAMRDVSPMMSTMYAGMFGIVALIPFTLPSFAVREPDAAFWGAILYIGFFSTVLAMVFWNIGVQKLGGTNAGMYLNFNPVFTALLASLILGENMTWVQGTGALLVICGLCLFTQSQTLLLRRRRKA